MIKELGPEQPDLKIQQQELCSMVEYIVTIHDRCLLMSVCSWKVFLEVVNL